MLRRSDRLRAELIPMLVAVGQPVSSAMRSYVQEAADRNTSEHAAYTTYYGDELRNLVAERDASIISRHEFKFGD